MTPLQVLLALSFVYLLYLAYSEDDRPMTSTNDKAARISDYISQCNGFENHYRHPLFRHATYSDGVKFVAQTAGAYWLIDAILSHQSALLAEDFQHWTLTLDGKGGAVLLCDDGGNGGPPRVLAKQVIPHTDFPLPEIHLYVEGGVLMLREER